MNKNSVIRHFLAAVIFMFALTSHAALIGFVSNPTTNSLDWAAAVAAAGGAVNNNVNFDSHSAGALQSNFYLASDGVTLTPSGDVNMVQFGVGPNNGNTSTPPLSSGEGIHIASNFLFDGGAPSTLIISFAMPVAGVGLVTIDYYNPLGNNPLTIEAFTGASGTGISLGSFSSAAFNFQADNQYFMGLFSTAGDIGSVVFTDVNSMTGDTTGIDDIRFATINSAPGPASINQVPEPASLALMGLGLVALGNWRRREAA
ncbi:MAG: PEP-CTERM sorting domain-containing protein [Burkholderiales bacterium]|nr:PEP-CTERM sorting domain-containing protein [Burkholderiales bacterium]